MKSFFLFFTQKQFAFSSVRDSFPWTSVLPLLLLPWDHRLPHHQSSSSSAFRLNLTTSSLLPLLLFSLSSPIDKAIVVAIVDEAWDRLQLWNFATFITVDRRGKQGHQLLLSGPSLLLRLLPFRWTVTLFFFVGAGFWQLGPANS